MGPRPADFDEQLVKQSPTFLKWQQLEPGDKLRYACREFIKGQGDDEERLMRRIMIARRNNLKDHDALKQARQRASRGSKPAKEDSSGSSSLTRKRRPATLYSDGQISKEMDVAAVEATRSYRAWSELSDGDEFVYNQKYTKGKDGHDWLLRKNIWRRMRYRRENKKLVETLKGGHGEAASIVDHALLPSADGSAVPSDRAGEKNSDDDIGKDVNKVEEGDYQTSDDAIEAAVALGVAAAESYAKQGSYNVVHNPLETGASTAALDAAAKLAAAAATNSMEDSSIV
jgi:hypothetical protein